MEPPSEKMGQIDLSVDMAGIHFENPFMLASGILDETGGSMVDIAEHGASSVVTKSLSLEPRKGHPNPCIVEMEWCVLNAMGLPNPGIAEYGKEVKEYREKVKKPIIASVFGSSIEEYAGAAAAVRRLGVDAVEINGSCPNAAGLGLQFGQDPDVVRELVKEVKGAAGIPVLFKLTPETGDILSLAEGAKQGGADGLVAVNTMRSMAVDISTRRPLLTNVYGGLSGPALKPIGLRCVHEIYTELGDGIPIIGVGGITTWEDAVEYLLAGALMVQIGTAVSYHGPSLFADLCSGLATYMEESGYSRIEDLRGSLRGCSR